MAAAITWSMASHDWGWIYSAAITAHTDGAVVSVTTQDVYGRVVRVVSIPDAGTAPSAAWDFQVKDADGVSIIGTTGDNRSATAAEQLVPSVPVPVAGALAITAQNMGSGGKAIVRLYVERIEE